jgi:dipeptidyl aminopeptidase/acylaminoacyl peptidase
VRFIKFPRQGHGIREPHLARIALVEEVRWFELHVRGEDWTPPLRGAESVVAE